MAIAFVRALDGNANSTSLTLANFLVDAADATNRVIVVGVTLDVSGGSTVTTMTRDGQNFTLAASSNLGGNKKTQIWYLSNPNVTTASIVITCSPSVRVGAGALLFTGIYPANPIHSFGNSSGTNGIPVCNIYTTIVNSLIVDVVCSDSVQADPDSGTTRWTESFSFNESRGSSIAAATSGSYTRTWGTGAGDWAMSAVSLAGEEYIGGVIRPENILRPAAFAPGIAR